MLPRVFDANVLQACMHGVVSMMMGRLLRGLREMEV